MRRDSSRTEYVISTEARRAKRGGRNGEIPSAENVISCKRSAAFAWDASNYIKRVQDAKRRNLPCKKRVSFRPENALAFVAEKSPRLLFRYTFHLVLQRRKARGWAGGPDMSSRATARDLKMSIYCLLQFDMPRSGLDMAARTAPRCGESF